MKYQVYTLTDPRTNIVKYVGKTQESLAKRLSKHIYDSKKHKNRRTNWLKNLLKNGFKPKIELLESFDNSQDCYFAEIYWISQFRTWGFNLVNATDGGEGSTNYKPSKETLQKMSCIMTKYWSTRKKPKEKKLSKKEQYSLLSKKLSTPINQYDLKGFKIKEWKSFNEIINTLNTGVGSITNALKNPERVAINSFWRYKINENNSKIIVKFKDVKKIKFTVINIENGDILIFYGKNEIEKGLNTKISSIYTSISNNTLFNKKFKIQKETYYGPHSRFMHK